MTPAQPALDAMMEGVTVQFRQAPRPHRSGEAVLDVVYADPGTHGFYYRDRKPDSVAAFVRMDHVAALAAEVRAQRETIAGLTARVEALTGALEGIYRNVDYWNTLQISGHIRLALSGEAPND
jgi:hypothetical protein